MAEHTLPIEPRFLAGQVTDAVRAQDLWAMLQLAQPYEAWLDSLQAWGLEPGTDWVTERGDTVVSVLAALVLAASAAPADVAVDASPAAARAAIVAQLLRRYRSAIQADLSGFDWQQHLEMRFNRRERSLANVYGNSASAREAAALQRRKCGVWLVAHGHLKVPE